MVKHCTRIFGNRPPPSESANLLLAALPAHEYKRIVQSLDPVSLKLKTLLHRAGEPIKHVYFPGGGFCSVLTVLKDGDIVEVATVGREGMVGITAVLDGGRVSSTSMVQGETKICYRMKANAFRQEMDRAGSLL
jgi:CRP-like cAMP-binding protein